MDWSYDLLDEVERRLLRRLGVFAGAFSLEAAEAIASKNGDLNSIEVFDTISRLVDKSLVVADDFETRSLPLARDDPRLRASTRRTTPASWPGCVPPTRHGGPNAWMPFASPARPMT